MWIRSLMTWMILVSLSGSLSLALSGCAGGSVDQNDPAQMYKEAEQDIGNDRYQLAIDKLRVIRNKYPYSKSAVDAQLRIADVFFLQESYAEAAASYETFRDLHPKHEKVSYAMYRVAKSYFNDIPNTVARDLTPAQKSLDAFNEFLRRFPEAAEVAEARQGANDSRKILADKELYIGDFYYKRDFYRSARDRYLKLVQLYPETDAAGKAKQKLDLIAKRGPLPEEKEAPPSGGSAGTY